MCGAGVCGGAKSYCMPGECAGVQKLAANKYSASDKLILNSLLLYSAYLDVGYLFFQKRKFLKVRVIGRLISKNYSKISTSTLT